MNQIKGPVLLIDDGGVASLAACCLASDPARVTCAGAIGQGPGAKSRAAAVRRRAELLGLADPVFLEAPPAPNADGPEPLDLPDGAVATDLLLRAAREAWRLGLGQVLWPVHCGADLDAMDRALARARLVERLVNLDLPAGEEDEPPLRIETPLLDLSDRQIAELAADLDAPLDVCWWCLKDGPAPCGRCGGCHRWEPALRETRGAWRTAAAD